MLNYQHILKLKFVLKINFHQVISKSIHSKNNDNATCLGKFVQHNYLVQLVV